MQLVAAVMICGVIGCITRIPSTAPDPSASHTGTTDPTAGAEAEIKIHGSSTVYPISQAVAEAFKKSHPAVEISVGSSGTSGGMGKFKLKEIDICDASRRIKDSEKQECAANGVDYLELQVAVDAITVAVNPANDWVDCLSISQLKKMWEPNSQVKRWSDIDPRWPQKELKLFGADTDSGTFEYFTEVVNGKAKESRTEYTANSNDNILVKGVADEKYGLGYFGFGYYEENRDRLKAVRIKAADDGECIAPTAENVAADKYRPLARPLFLYVNKASLQRPEMADFLKFYLSDEGQIEVSNRKFLRMKSDVLEEMRQRLAEALGGK